MRAFCARIRGRASDQAGFTLVELMVVAALLAVVLTAILSLLDTSAKLAPEDQERGLAIREAQVGLRQMTTELRSAYQLDTTNPYYLSARVYTRGVNKRVAYDCSGSAANPAWGQCVRVDLAGARPSVSLIKAIVNKQGSTRPPVFTYTTRPSDGRITYVNIHTEVPVRKNTNGRYSYSVPLEDGVYLRNLDG